MQINFAPTPCAAEVEVLILVISDLPWLSTFQIRADNEATHYVFQEWPPLAHAHTHQYSDFADQD